MFQKFKFSILFYLSNLQIGRSARVAVSGMAAHHCRNHRFKVSLQRWSSSHETGSELPLSAGVTLIESLGDFLALTLFFCHQFIFCCTFFFFSPRFSSSDAILHDMSSLNAEDLLDFTLIVILEA